MPSGACPAILVFWALALLTVCALPGCSAERDRAAGSQSAERAGEAGTVTEARAAAERPNVLLGISWEGQTAMLVRIEPPSLRPVGTERIALGRATSSPSFSPDESQLALATAEDPARLRLIDVVRMRAVGDVELGRGSIEATAWLAPGRLVAAIETPDGVVLATIDIAERRVLSRRPLGGQIADLGRLRDRLVLLLSPRGAIGPARLATIDAEGSVEAVTLERTYAGIELDESSQEGLGKGRGPGLAIDQALRRAYVVGAGEAVAEVELDGLRVGYHELARPVSLLGRLRNWLEPTAQAKGVSGPFRHARWLGNGLVAVSGYDDQTYIDASGTWHYEGTPAGLTLIDTNDWSTETVDEKTSSFSFVARTLVALNDDGSIRGYAIDGTETFAFANLEPIGIVLTAGHYAYVFRMDNSVAVIDVREPAIVGRLKTDIQSVLASDITDF
jgi:hypothetical protein